MTTTHLMHFTFLNHFVNSRYTRESKMKYAPHVRKKMACSRRFSQKTLQPHCLKEARRVMEILEEAPFYIYTTNMLQEGSHCIDIWKVHHWLVLQLHFTRTKWRALLNWRDPNRWYDKRGQSECTFKYHALAKTIKKPHTISNRKYCQCRPHCPLQTPKNEGESKRRKYEPVKK